MASSLADFAAPTKMWVIDSIQDKFNEAGVEIMSPTYSALRDGNRVTIPESYLPADYEAPGFSFSPGNLAPAERPAPKDGS